jgi:hypothetical protein
VYFRVPERPIDISLMLFWVEIARLPALKVALRRRERLNLPTRRASTGANCSRTSGILILRLGCKS